MPPIHLPSVKMITRSIPSSSSTSSTSSHARSSLLRLTSPSSSSSSSSPSSRSLLLHRLMATTTDDASSTTPKAQPKKSLVRERLPSLYDDFQHDETTVVGHEMVQKERDALAFMRTVELELPKLKPIPFEKPNLDTHYIRYHTQKTWPTEHDSKESIPVTLSCPISRLPLSSPSAKHKFLLLTTPDYHHPLRPVAFSRSYEYHRRNNMKPGPWNRKHSRGVESLPTHTSSYKDDVYGQQPPRVGGWTPSGREETREWDTSFRLGMNDRKGEDRDGWFVIKSDLFPYQLQNKKWCEDTLRRLVAEANDETDPMTDIPLDMTPYTNTYMRERRRPDGTLPNVKDWPSSWNLPSPSLSSSPFNPDQHPETSSNPSSFQAPPPPSLSEHVSSLQSELRESAEVTPTDITLEQMDRVKRGIDEEPVVRPRGAEPMVEG